VSQRKILKSRNILCPAQYSCMRGMRCIWDCAEKW